MTRLLPDPLRVDRAGGDGGAQHRPQAEGPATEAGSSRRGAGAAGSPPAGASGAWFPLPLLWPLCSSPSLLAKEAPHCPHPPRCQWEKWV